MSTVTMYFDGMCPLCKREVALLKRLDKTGKIKWHDISTGLGDLAEENITFEEAMQQLHARDRNNKIRKGVDAFITIWRELPYFRVLAFLGSLPGIKWLAKVSYAVFAKRRLKVHPQQCDNKTCL
ncbi:DUF393 domain-containing protein [Candidatus Parabeggiatoa sp. HSG14]|uniref:thiol-disulfide oxidoreductase DCC family protein n=1 Tax=Candidatus Parabeggiatoa sp. HSG14 TaxID=3055593 RepID=UPI0025A6F0EF|nr:DUF393 domain-containing protein [Thiotrichales bacterium HSG14]